MDQIFIYPDIDAVPSNNDPFSEAMTYIGRSNFSHLQLAFRLTCGADSYGPSCTRCIPSNDSSTGYYTCDGTTGERLCLEGYQNPGNLCLDCIPADNCSEWELCEKWVTVPFVCVCVQVQREAIVRSLMSVDAELAILVKTVVSSQATPSPSLLQSLSLLSPLSQVTACVMSSPAALWGHVLSMLVVC